jgi:hypothetical protein
MKVLGFKINRIQREMGGYANQIFLCQVDFALCLTAGRAAGLAFETEAGFAYLASRRLIPVVMIRSFFRCPGIGLLI